MDLQEKKDDEQPVFQNSLLGFRTWGINLKEAKLQAAAKEYCWEPGLNIAVCEEKCGQGSPGTSCHCGFNAFYDLKDAEDSDYNGDYTIIGAIAGAGKIELHSTGFRSEQAQIIAFFAEDNFIYRGIANAYSVPLFTRRDQFLKFVSVYADSIKKVKSETSLDISESTLREVHFIEKKKEKRKKKEDFKKISFGRKLFLNSARFIILMAVMIIGAFLIKLLWTPGWDQHGFKLGLTLFFIWDILFLLAVVPFLIFPYVFDFPALEKEYLKRTFIGAAFCLCSIMGLAFVLSLSIPKKDENNLKREVHSEIVAATVAMEEAYKTNGRYPEFVPEISLNGKQVNSNLFNVEATNNNQNYSMTRELPSGEEVIISGHQGVEIKATCSNNDDAACNDGLYDFTKAMPFIDNIFNPDLEQKCYLDYTTTFEYDNYYEDLPSSWAPSFKC